MLSSVSNLKGASIAATDGEIGSVQDLYFDDRTWTIRYLVVDTGAWLPGRQVLISPRAVSAGAAEHRIPVALTKRQVDGSPSIEADLPVDRQYEREYSRYYGYADYWTGPYRWGTTPYPGGGALSTGRPMSTLPRVSGDSRLRSAREVMDYDIEAMDGDIGHVEDFLVDDLEWAIRYMIVDTRNWWPGRRVLISPEWIRQVSWSASRVSVDMTKEEIKSAPEYDPDRPLAREYETRLYGHHHRRVYWD